ncbi:DUF3253 domain-containing protein [Variovorax paradoxus]|uniref:DUF3253 domain-containing protein n=1 Tax=Variovorax paradoxus TaxID=34073 RepID=A0A679JRW4_VARPD|nr:hypothetical protein VVAX_05310 [Variovorax paradoxus]
MNSDETIERTIFELLAQRDAAASICPSEVARALAKSDAAWRALMPDVRRVASELAAKGALRVTRGADEVDSTSPGGPVRLRRPK